MGVDPQYYSENQIMKLKNNVLLKEKDRGVNNRSRVLEEVYTKQFDLVNHILKLINDTTLRKSSDANLTLRDPPKRRLSLTKNRMFRSSRNISIRGFHE